MDKVAALHMAEEYVCPDRVRFLHGAGIDLLIGRREGYRIWDVDGKELLDLHLNGGVYNLGHRNPSVVATLTAALDSLDIGNHHFPSQHRAMLARDLVTATRGMRYAVFASGGGEAIDLAIKSARRATGRTRVVCAEDAYHGHTGLALAAGDRAAAESFGSLGTPGEFVRIPFNDLEALAEALSGDDVAAVILETVPATAGFVPPQPDYLAGVRDLCTRHGSLYIADEVQTGLGRTGTLWGVDVFGVVPDILVTGKGLSGGIYPIAATLLSQRAGEWLESDGWSHISTFGGAELGCVVARDVMAQTTADRTRDNVARLIELWRDGLTALQAKYPQWVATIRQTGLVIGLGFHHEAGGMLMTRLLYDEGVWAMFAGFDRSFLQVKPGLLLTADDTALALAAFDRACAKAAAL
jgi:acetylornithine/succinyldiaminopimelate/putrescine aminotransferase